MLDEFSVFSFQIKDRFQISNLKFQISDSQFVYLKTKNRKLKTEN
jgi:hypothetical protein